MSATTPAAPSAAVAAAIAAVTAPLEGVGAIPCTPKNPRGLDPTVPFASDPKVIALLDQNAGLYQFPRPIAALIAGYATQHLDNVIFGPRHWEQCWNATPITLPDVETLRAQVASAELKIVSEVGEMSAEACATLLLEHGKAVGTVDNPVPPEALIAFLNTPARAGEEPNLLRYVVTYIPSHVRIGNKILAVTARTLALELAPNPNKGCHAAKLENPAYALDRVLTANDADGTQEASCFVMERDVAPGTRREKPSVLLERVKQQGEGWSAPQARNFMATVFSIRALTGVLLFGQEPWTYTYGEGRSRGNHFLVFGGFAAAGLGVYTGNYDDGNVDNGAGGSREVSAIGAWPWPLIFGRPRRP